jgi:hypothetical protein
MSMSLSVIGLMGIAMQTPIQSNGEIEVLDLLPFLFTFQLPSPYVKYSSLYAINTQSHHFLERRCDDGIPSIKK